MYQKEITEVMNEVNSSPSGLSQQEAAKALRKWLESAERSSQKSSLILFLETFKDAMVIVLLIVAIVQMIMGAHVESIVIFAVLLLNSVVSVIQTKKQKDR